MKSMQWYNFASFNGSVAADIGISRWYCANGEQIFEANWDIAFTYISKAARRGLSFAEAVLQYLDQASWIMFFPGLAIVCAVLSLQLVGDGLRDLLDPRLSKDI